MSDAQDTGETRGGSPARSGRVRRYLPTLAVVVIGVLLSAVLRDFIHRWERNESGSEFSKLAENRRALLQKKLDATQEVLYALGAHYAASEVVDRGQFREFTRGALRRHEREIWSLEWVPRVPAEEVDQFVQTLQDEVDGAAPDGLFEIDEDRFEIRLVEPRTEYFPTFFCEPENEDTQDLLGYNNNARGILNAIMEEAGRTTQLVASEWTTRLGTAAPEHRVVILVVPVYGPGPPPVSEEERLEELEGFALATVRLNWLIEVEGDGDEGFEMYLSESEPGTKIEILGRQKDDDLLFSTDDPGRWKWTEHEHPLTLAGRKWRLFCVPEPGSTVGFRPWLEWFVLGTGLAVTALIAVFLLATIGRSQQIEQKVADATGELRREIADRERAERTLKNSEALYHSLVENAPMSIFRKDLKGRLVFVNSSYARAINRKKTELYGLTDYDLFPKELAEKYRADDAKLIETGEVHEDVEAHTTPDGRSLFVHVLKAPVQDAAGEIVGTQGMFWDVTDRKRAEQELLDTAEELSRSNADLEQFAYVASHDLQEPLRMVASYTRLLQKRYQDKLDEDANEFIGFAVDGATRMQKLITDLLAYSRVGSRGKPLERTDTSSALSSAMANLKIAIDESSATVTHDELPDVMADETQLTQVFQNLVGNAIKFHRDDVPPVVHVGVKEAAPDKEKLQKGMVEFFVRDNGIGIAEKFFERIFVIFQRLHGRGEFAGTGIGLSLCKKIVERHGGRIRVRSTPGEGTTVLFTLNKAPAN